MEERPVSRPARVALVGLPRLVEDLVATLVEHWADFELCGRLRDEDLLRDFRDTNADILICAMEDAKLAASWARVLQETPRPAVVNLVDGERAATAFYLRPSRTETPELDAESLRAVLRGCSVTRLPPDTG